AWRSPAPRGWPRRRGVLDSSHCDLDNTERRLQTGTTSYQKVWEWTPPLQQPTHRALPETPLSTPHSEHATFAQQRKPVTPTSSSSAAASPASASPSTRPPAVCPSPSSNAATSPRARAVGVPSSPTADCATSPRPTWRSHGNPPSNAAG